MFCFELSDEMYRTLRNFTRKLPRLDNKKDTKITFERILEITVCKARLCDSEECRLENVTLTENIFQEVYNEMLSYGFVLECVRFTEDIGCLGTIYNFCGNEMYKVKTSDPKFSDYVNEIGSVTEEIYYTKTKKYRVLCCYVMGVITQKSIESDF